MMLLYHWTVQTSWTNDHTLCISLPHVCTSTKLNIDKVMTGLIYGYELATGIVSVLASNVVLNKAGADRYDLFRLVPFTLWL